MRCPQHRKTKYPGEQSCPAEPATVSETGGATLGHETVPASTVPASGQSSGLLSRNRHVICTGTLTFQEVFSQNQPRKTEFDQYHQPWGVSQTLL